ncbi:1-acyl-sn-glycerol-3-phosphate acyltransferase lpat1, chloroplastic [Ancistrocladus abbreviatus]
MLSSYLLLPLATPVTGVVHCGSCYGKGNILCSGVARSSKKLESAKVKLESGVSSLRFSKFGSDTEQDIGCSLQNPAVLNRSIKWSIFCIQRRYIGGYESFEPSREFYKTSYGMRLDSHYRPLRHIVVRSDLAKTGTPDAAYPLSEPNLWPKVRGLCFYATTAVMAICLIGLMLVVHPFVLMFDPYRRRFQHLIARIWATLTIVPFIKVEYEGLENLPRPDTPAVYVSNHQSFLDIYTLLTLGRSFKFISKTSIFLYPVIGWAMSLMGVIPLKRMDSQSQLECLKRCMDLIRHGASVFFFPEGTRSKDGRLGGFKKGAFSVAAKTQVPVVPITLCGTGHIMPVGREGLVYPGTVKAVIHRPLVGNDPEVLRNKTRSIIADTLHHQG